MTTPFPLLRLPRLVLIPVLQQMEPIDIIALSLLSNRARLLTKTAGLSVTSISILAKNRILNIDMVQRDGKNILISLMSQNHTEFVIVFVDYYTPVWRILGLSTAECIHRILDVTNCESIQKLKFCEAVSFDALPIPATLPHIKQIYISRDCNEVFVHKMLEMLSKVTSNIIMWQDRFANLEQFQKVLMLNMYSITINVMNIRDPTRVRLSLDDLLICNAVHLHLYDVIISVKTLNRFFKLWMRKKSNPRLEHFILITSEEVSPDVLLKGLNAIEMPQTTTRTFRASDYPNSRCQEKVVTGGMDVMRSDGTRATLEIKAMPGISVVEFYALFFYGTFLK
ncbi:hypothetical protein GCK72_021223 [Caenorhabditis remanei]|uniref:F-box domain-containing protein n=1 Tax=Caenorhabditis remanei TaxID=31234 RepID=A0A6A5GHJ9_CAERE|nr:hypothetical protein GCK72_021223 [Caenorhabditis remanei]KAF1754660.1 hypothetical protein GCK72_021223 [Caenorhabditis remanei]